MSINSRDHSHPFSVERKFHDTVLGTRYTEVTVDEDWCYILRV